jgi:hypothetical protein
MANQNIFGNIRSVKIFDSSKKGEIILRTTTGEITLKLSDDHDSAFSGMAAVASAAVEFGNVVTPNIHVKYDDDDMEIDEITFIQSKDACPVAPGACVPVALGSKPKQSRRFKLDKILSNINAPSAIGASFFHMSRRYLADKNAANALEESVFNKFRRLPPNLHRLLACTLDSFDSLTSDERNRLFVANLLGDIDKPIEPTQLKQAFFQEIEENLTIKVFDDPRCATEEFPGLVRTQPNPGGEFPPSQVLVCKINDFPSEQSHTFVVGEGVVLQGMNFSHIDTKVQFMDSTTGNVIQLDAFVCGDAETSLTENINGIDVPIIDCRVHDRLRFIVPLNMIPGQYFLQVLVPNPDHVGGWADPLNSDGVTVMIDVPSTARYQISSETLTCKDETHADLLGSDEVGIMMSSIPLLPDATIGEIQMPNNGNAIRFGDVDSDETRTMDHVLFSNQQQIVGVALTIKGYEIDSEDAFENEITSWWAAFKDFIKDAVLWILPDSGSIDFGNPFVFIAVVIAAIILCLVAAFYALWAPADPIIEDMIGLSSLDLFQFTNMDFPLPLPTEYRTTEDIKVKVTPLEKTTQQYRELREYFSDDGNSHYQIILRYNRLT